MAARETNQPLLPNFFVIGAEKAGTTSLHSYLSHHPEISMTTVKEPNTFSGPSYEERLADYQQWLRRDAAVRGESSTRYSNVGVYPGVAPRIGRLVPEARIIYLVRDPIPRILSHWRDRARNGDENRSLTESLEDYASDTNRYVGASRYGTQLAPYLEQFPSDRVLVLDQRQLLDDRVSTIDRVHEFLGVAPLGDSPLYSEQLNVDKPTRVPTAFGAASRRYPGLAAVRRLPVPEAARRLVRPLTSRPAPSELPAELERAISRHLEPEVERLRQFTGLQFADWGI